MLPSFDGIERNHRGEQIAKVLPYAARQALVAAARTPITLFASMSEHEQHEARKPRVQAIDDTTQRIRARFPQFFTTST